MKALVVKWINHRIEISRIFIIIAFLLGVASNIINTYVWINGKHSDLILTLESLFNVNHSRSFSEWYITLLLLGVVILCVITAQWAYHNLQWHYYYWLFISIGFLVILEAKSDFILHLIPRSIRSYLSSDNTIVYGLMAVMFFLGIFILWYGLQFFLTLHTKTKKLFFLGIMILLFSALGLERIGEVFWYMTRSPNIIYNYLGSIEEFFETVGIIIIQFSLLDYLNATKLLIEK